MRKHGNFGLMSILLLLFAACGDYMSMEPPIANDTLQIIDTIMPSVDYRDPYTGFFDGVMTYSHFGFGDPYTDTTYFDSLEVKKNDWEGWIDLPFGRSCQFTRSGAFTSSPSMVFVVSGEFTGYDEFHYYSSWTGTHESEWWTINAHRH